MAALPPTMCDTNTLNYGWPVQSSVVGGLYAHISSSAQLFTPEYQHHPKVDLR